MKFVFASEFGKVFFVFDLEELKLVILLLLELEEGFLFEGEFLFELFFDVGFFVVYFVDFGFELFVLCFELSDFEFEGFIFAHEGHVLPFHEAGGEFRVFEIPLVLVGLVLIGAIFEFLIFAVGVLTAVG